MRVFFVVLMSMLLVSCSGKETYPPLGYIGFKTMPISDIAVLREDILAYMKTKECVAQQSSQTKFFESKGQGKKARKFVDVYDCKDNVLVFMNQVNLTVSFYEAKKVKTQKWRAIGQEIEALVQKKDPSLKFIWNKANIKANVVVKG